MQNQRYYWMKLKTDFFSMPEIAYLMSLDNGEKYVLLFLALCLMTANNDGEMVEQLCKLSIPYDTARIVRDTKFYSTEIVNDALTLFQQIGLISIQDNGIMMIPLVKTMVGSETKYAVKKRAYRQHVSNSSGRNEGTLSDKSKDKRVKNIYIPSMVKGSNVGYELGNGASSLLDDSDTPIQVKKPKEIMATELVERFEKLWQHYPRKEGRPAAFKAYTKAIKDGVTDAKIETGIIQYIAYIQKLQREPEFIKMGSTWFSQHGWEDEYDAINTYRRSSVDDIPDIGEFNSSRGLKQE